MHSVKKKINSAVIGLGVGEFHAKNLHKDRRTNLILVCDKNPKKNILLRKKYTNCKFTKNPNTIFNNPLIDLVCIASYDNYHYKHIINSIDSKKNFFIEKPFCLTEMELTKIFFKLKKNKNIQFSSNLVLRNSPQFLELKKNIFKNVMGKIYHIEGNYNYGRMTKITNGWRGKIPFYSVTLGGGLHVVDLILWLTGQRVEKVISIGNKLSTFKTKFKYNDNVVALLKFTNGMTAKVNSNFSCVTPHHHSLEVFGTRKTFIQKYKKFCYFKNRSDSNPSEKLVNYPKKMKSKILSSFIDSLYNRKMEPIVKKQEILNAMSVSLAIERSISSGVWEKVNYYNL